MSGRSSAPRPAAAPCVSMPRLFASDRPAAIVAGCCRRCRVTTATVKTTSWKSAAAPAVRTRRATTLLSPCTFATPRYIECSSWIWSSACWPSVYARATSIPTCVIVIDSTLMRFVKSLLKICVFARDAPSGRSRVCWATSPSTLRQPALRPAFCGFCRADTASFMSTTAIRVTDPSRPKCACGLWSTVIGANFLAATIRVPPVVFKRARPACCWSGATSGWWVPSTSSTATAAPVVVRSTGWWVVSRRDIVAALVARAASSLTAILAAAAVVAWATLTTRVAAV